MVLGLILSAVGVGWQRARCSRAIAMIVLGPAALDGRVPTSKPAPRAMAFNIPELADGLGFCYRRDGAYSAFAEIIRNLDAGARDGPRPGAAEDYRPYADQKGPDRPPRPAILRGTVLGSILGILPGGRRGHRPRSRPYTLEKKDRQGIRPRFRPRRRNRKASRPPEKRQQRGGAGPRSFRC